MYNIKSLVSWRIPIRGWDCAATGLCDQFCLVYFRDMRWIKSSCGMIRLIGSEIKSFVEWFSFNEIDWVDACLVRDIVLRIEDEKYLWG